MTTGTHVVTYTAPTGGAAVDISCLVDTVSIHHGRDDTTGQPDAPSCTVEFSLDVDIDNYPPVDVGGTLKVTTTVGGTTYTRFIGVVTDYSQEWTEAGPDTPDWV